jgi:hypothetical protein
MLENKKNTKIFLAISLVIKCRIIAQLKDSMGTFGYWFA